MRRVLSTILGLLLCHFGAIAANAQSSPSLGTDEELRRLYGSTYTFTIRVDAVGFDYSSAESWIKSTQKHSRKGSHSVGHSWIQVSNGVLSVCGGHSGESSADPNAKWRDSRITDPRFFTYSSGVATLASLAPAAPSPLPTLLNDKGQAWADPRNPAAWLFFLYEDGHWEENSAGHDRVTHEASWSISEAEYKAVVEHVIALTKDNGKALRQFGLTGKQCTATAAELAKKANIDLDPFIEIKLPKELEISGTTVRLRESDEYATIRIAAPEAMARELLKWTSTKNSDRKFVARTK